MPVRIVGVDAKIDNGSVGNDTTSVAQGRDLLEDERKPCFGLIPESKRVLGENRMKENGYPAREGRVELMQELRWFNEMQLSSRGGYGCVSETDSSCCSFLVVGKQANQGRSCSEVR